MSSDASLASLPEPRCASWLALAAVLLGCAIGCRDQVVIGTEPAADPDVDLPNLSDAGDGEPRADAAPESDGDDDGDDDDDIDDDSDEDDADSDAPDSDD